MKSGKHARAGRHVVGTALGLGLALLGAPSGAASQGAAAGVAECRVESLWVVRVDGAAAVGLHALELAGRIQDAPTLRHRPSQRLRLLRCPGDRRSPALRTPPESRGDGFAAFATARAAANSAYPRGGNDGALWQGRGFSGILRPGVAFGSRFFTAAVAPELVGWQNADFDRVADDGEPADFGHPFHTNIDWPVRPGGDAGGELLPGQSFARVDLWLLAGGVSTANVRFGPARHFPLLLGSGAPGFPHAFLGTAGPLRLGPVGIDLESFAGELSESGYFDVDPSNDRRALIGTHLALSFGAEPWLWLGGLRVYSEYIVPGQSAYDVLRENLIDVPFVAGDENLPGNGLASVSVRLAPPGSGFELYGEYGREDYPYDLDDLIREPDWTRTYNLGASKLFGGRRPVLVNAELVNVSLSNPERAGKGWFTWYTHGVIVQGHTERGQLLGAWVGPGSTAQRMSADVFTDGGLLGGYIQRVAYDEDTFYRAFGRAAGSAGHDIELTAGAHGLRHALGGTVWVELSISHRRNRGFAYSDGRATGEWNLGLDLRLLY